MNSYIRLKNGLIINLSQIEACGPILPYNLTDLGLYEKYDLENIENGVFDIPNTLDAYTDPYVDDLRNNLFCVPSDSPLNNVYNEQKQDSSGYVLLQQYMLLLKSGRIILLTQAEYDNICNVMEFDNNYSNIDYKYSKFN